jgi:site-specific recombinase XerD
MQAAMIKANKILLKGETRKKVDLHCIQALLGQESTKTTEFYTNVTTKGFEQIKSPLDNLDI